MNQEDFINLVSTYLKTVDHEHNEDDFIAIFANKAKCSEEDAKAALDFAYAYCLS